MARQLTSDDAAPPDHDVAQRLRALGFLASEEPVAGVRTTAAIAAFQRSRRLDDTGRCDPTTYRALLEAEHEFGARPLYLTAPMLRGDDVATLQLLLGSLGFNAGRVDGFFGADTQSALREFQRNVGLVVDGVCARDSVAQLQRLSSRSSTVTVAGIREREALSNRSTRLAGLRIAICHRGEEPALAGALAADLHSGEAEVTMRADDDWSVLARATNEFAADLCLAIELSPTAGIDVAFYATEGFESDAGRTFAEALVRELPHPPGWRPSVAHGMRLPILRETRCPTVRLRIGSVHDVSELSSLIVAAVTRAVRSWIAPAEPATD